MSANRFKDLWNLTLNQVQKNTPVSDLLEKLSITVGQAAVILGLPGAAGAAGAPGAVGASGPAGPQGIPGVGLTTFAEFYALVPPDTAVVAGGAPMHFDNAGPTSGVGITALGTTSWVLAAAGTYDISWQAEFNEPAELVLRVNGVIQAHTAAARTTGTTQLMNRVLVTTVTGNSVIDIINPGTTALTPTPAAGPDIPLGIGATLVIIRIQ